MPSKKNFSKKDLSILFGNLLDHYDAPLYGMLAPILAPLFVPNHDPVIQLILAYSLFFSSIITRPLGSVLFSLMAVKKGPSYSLAISLIGIAIATLLIGCLPIYSTAGNFAPFALICVRMIKGVFAAGESTIAKIYILEDKSKSDAYTISYFYQSSSIVGVLLASLMVMLVTSQENPEQYWRYPFLLGSLVGIFGFYLRYTQIVDKVKFNSKRLVYPSMKLIWQEKRAIIKIAIATSFSYLTYSVPFVFFNAFIPLITKITLYQMMQLNSFLLAFDGIMIFVLGKWTKNFATEKVMWFASALFAFTIIPLFIFLPNSTLIYVTFVRIWIVVIGLIYCCPLYLFYLEQFSGDSKYLLIGIGNSIGTATVGRITTVFCLWLFHYTDSILAPAIYCILIAILAMTIAYKAQIKR